MGKCYPHVFGIRSRGILVIGGYIHFGACRDREILIARCVASSDLWPLGVKSNSNLTPLLNLLCFAGMIDDGLVVFIGSVGKVHADDIEAGFAELVDGLDRICLGTDCADDRGSAVIFCGLEFGIQLGEPTDLRCARCEVLHGRCNRHVVEGSM